MSSELVLRVAESQQDAILAFAAYKTMHEEGVVPGALHELKTMTNVLRLTNGPDSCVLMAMDGEVVAGVLALLKEAYWYSEDTFLGDKGLYVLPAYRNAGALDLLLDAAADTSNGLGIPAFVTIFNLKRKRGGRSKWERVGATLGYTNRGAIIAHYPET